jgi:F-type H+-transporting ATPase subunit b
MRRRQAVSLAAFLFLFCLLGGSLAAQNSAEGSTAQKAEQSNAPAEQAAGDASAGVGEILAKTSEKAASAAEKWGRKLGLGHDTSFLLSILLNFGGVVAVFYVLLKSKLPQAFRERTAAIKKGIKEAEAASGEASRRLGEIESRLGKLDAEIAEVRASAEREATAEEERIHKAAEEDKQKIIQAAEAEIAAIARNARRELKGYAASLAVDIAAREIKIDENTDRALLHEFVSELGRDGQ